VVYEEGTGRATAALIEAVNGERVSLTLRPRITPHPLVDVLADGGFTAREADRTGKVQRAFRPPEDPRCQRPPSLDHRHLHEDLRWGLVQWIELARATGVDTTTMSAIETLAGALNIVDRTTASRSDRCN
jgi:hypothetical protein